MVVGRRYLVVLVLAVVGAAAWIVVPQVSNSIHAAQAKRDNAAAAAAFTHLSVPADFVHVSALDGGPCVASLCYRINRPTHAVGALISAILRSVGVTKANTLITGNSCQTHQRPGICQGFGYLDHNAMSVFVEPYLACSTPRNCRRTAKSQVLINAPKPTIYS
jgi:hypothetical protein